MQPEPVGKLTDIGCFQALKDTAFFCSSVDTNEGQTGNK